MMARLREGAQAIPAARLTWERLFPYNLVYEAVLAMPRMAAVLGIHPEPANAGRPAEQLQGCQGMYVREHHVRGITTTTWPKREGRTRSFALFVATSSAS
jgi:hypothetical protein